MLVVVLVTFVVTWLPSQLMEILRYAQKTTPDCNSARVLAVLFYIHLKARPHSAKNVKFSIICTVLHCTTLLLLHCM